jgi:hypothetical protein
MASSISTEDYLAADAGLCDGLLRPNHNRRELSGEHSSNFRLGVG